MSPLDPKTIVNLSRPLDQRRVKHREGGGGKSLSYLPSHDVIRTANAIIGYGQWGHVVEELVCIGVEPITNKSGKHGNRVGYRCTVRLSVAGCLDTSGVGYGDAQEYNGSLITPHELAMKEAESDAVKRALKNFGDQFGLILYAKPEDQNRINQAARIREQRAIEAAEAEEAALLHTPADRPSAVTASAGDSGVLSVPSSAGESGISTAPDQDGDGAGATKAGSAASPAGVIPDHALPFVLPETVLEVVIDQIGGEVRADLIGASWLSMDAQTLATRLSTQEDANIIQLCGHIEATHKARKGLLKSVKARLDKLAAPTVPEAPATVSVAQGALATAMDAAAKAGHTVSMASTFVDPGDSQGAENTPADVMEQMNRESAEANAAEPQRFYDKATGTSGRGPFTSPALMPEVTPLMRLRALIAFVKDQPSAVEPGMVPHLSSEQGVLDAVKASAWGVYASLDEMPPDDVNAVWQMAPAETRKHIESLSFEDCAALAEEAI